MGLRRGWGVGADGMEAWVNGGVCTAIYTMYIESYMVAERRRRRRYFTFSEKHHFLTTCMSRTA